MCLFFSRFYERLRFFGPFCWLRRFQPHTCPYIVYFEMTAHGEVLSPSQQLKLTAFVGISCVSSVSRTWSTCHVRRTMMTRTHGKGTESMQFASYSEFPFASVRTVISIPTLCQFQAWTSAEACVDDGTDDAEPGEHGRPRNAELPRSCRRGRGRCSCSRPARIPDCTRLPANEEGKDGQRRLRVRQRPLARSVTSFSCGLRRTTTTTTSTCASFELIRGSSLSSGCLCR